MTTRRNQQLKLSERVIYFRYCSVDWIKFNLKRLSMKSCQKGAFLILYLLLICLGCNRVTIFRCKMKGSLTQSYILTSTYSWRSHTWMRLEQKVLVSLKYRYLSSTQVSVLISICWLLTMHLCQNMYFKYSAAFSSFYDFFFSLWK